MVILLGQMGVFGMHAYIVVCIGIRNGIETFVRYGEPNVMRSDKMIGESAGRMCFNLYVVRPPCAPPPALFVSSWNCMCAAVAQLSLTPLISGDGGGASSSSGLAEWSLAGLATLAGFTVALNYFPVMYAPGNGV